MSSLNARSATVDQGVTAPSPVTQTEGMHCSSFSVCEAETMRHEQNIFKTTLPRRVNAT